MIPGQAVDVLHQAADLARSLGVELVLAHVDVTRVQVTDRTAARAVSSPIDPDGVDEEVDVADTSLTLQARLAAELAAEDVHWRFVQLAGEPAKALGQLAATLQARVIVVGTREPGMGARLEEILTGSVAVHLTHRQHCPVLVIPLGSHSNRGGA